MGILMTIILIVLKLFKCISIGWSWVFAPMTAEAIFWASLIVIIVKEYVKERRK